MQSLLLLLVLVASCQAFSLVMMGARRGKGDLKRSLDPNAVGGKKGSIKGTNALNSGKGQEITGVSLPADGELVVNVCPCTYDFLRLY